MGTRASEPAAFQSMLKRFTPAAREQAEQLAKVVDDIASDDEITTGELLGKLAPTIARLRESGYDAELTDSLRVLVSESRAKVTNEPLLTLLPTVPFPGLGANRRGGFERAPIQTAPSAPVGQLSPHDWLATPPMSGARWRRLSQ